MIKRSPTNPERISYPDILSYALAILNTSDGIEKCMLTYEAYDLYHAKRIPICVGNIGECPIVPNTPARPTNLIVVKPTDLVKKIRHDPKANALRLIHAQAHIESYAVDLSWDILARFCHADSTVLVTSDHSQENEETKAAPDSQEDSTDATRKTRTYLPNNELLPLEYFEDWLQVAEDEARHFMAWNDRLIELGSSYGSFPTHNSLWESADTTKHCLLSRLAVVHMVHEAHGLDCGDRLVKQFISAGDPTSAKLLQQIQREEIDHVSAGVKWFKYVCKQAAIDEIPRFHTIVRESFRGGLRPPFAIKERALAGMTEDWYVPLSVKIERPVGKPLPHKIAKERKTKKQEWEESLLKKAEEEAAAAAKEQISQTAPESQEETEAEDTE